MSAAIDWRQEIQKTSFGEHLSLANLERLMEGAKFYELRAGQYLFREGQRDERVYLLLEGQVDLSMSVPGRGATRILSLGNGDLIAWSAILGDGTMTCSAMALNPSRLLGVECRIIQDLIDTNHQFGYEFMKMMATALAKRLVATRLQLLDLFGRT